MSGPAWGKCKWLVAALIGMGHLLTPGASQDTPGLRETKGCFSQERYKFCPHKREK